MWSADDAFSRLLVSIFFLCDHIQPVLFGCDVRARIREPLNVDERRIWNRFEASKRANKSIKHWLLRYRVTQSQSLRYCFFCFMQILSLDAMTLTLNIERLELNVVVKWIWNECVSSKIKKNSLSNVAWARKRPWKPHTVMALKRCSSSQRWIFYWQTVEVAFDFNSPAHTNSPYMEKQSKSIENNQRTREKCRWLAAACVMARPHLEPKSDTLNECQP